MSRTANSQTTPDEARSSLAGVFSEGPFRFRLGTRPGDAADFFAATEPHDEILAERRHWLASDAARYAVLLPGAEPVLDAAIERLTDSPPSVAAGAPFERLLALGRYWEPDFVLLGRDAAGQMVVVGGCVCFPTNWRLTDKLNEPVGGVHEVVPGLNANIGAGIDNFLSRMKPGCWERSNWGMARSNQRNQHPDLHPPGFSADTVIEDVWLRIEDQALVPLAEVAGVLFAIRVRHIALVEVIQNPLARQRLRTAIETMSPEMLAYKNIGAIREHIVGWLSAQA
jgi:dimethylamine monooxygenase subunit A